MENKLIVEIVMLTVAIILVGALLVPVIGTTTTDTYTNTASGGIEYVIADDFTISKEADSTDVTIDGTVFSVTGDTDLLICSDDLVLNRANSSILLIDSSGTVTTLTDVAFSGTCTDNSFTYTVGTDDAVTATLTNVMVATTDGDYVSISDNGDVYVTGVDDIRAWTWKNGALLVSNGYDVTGSPSNTYTDAATVAITVEDYKVAKSDITFTYYGNTIAANTMIVPKEVSLYKDNLAMIAVIPLIMLAAAVIMAARNIMGNKE